jgi:hypothetical protein
MSAAWEVLVLQVQEMSGDDGALLGAVSIEVDGAIPQPGNDARGSLWDSVMHGASIGAPRSTALGDVTTTPESSGITDLVGVQIAPARFPQFSTPAYRLKAGGGQRGVRVFACCHRGVVVA